MTSRTLRLAYLFLRTAALEDRIAFLTRKYPKVPGEDIRKLATIDPTQGKYLEWLIRQYDHLSPFLDSMNNVEFFKELLSIYDKAKKSPVLLDRMGLSADINQVHLNDLYSMWAKYRGVDLDSERQKVEKAKKLATSVIYDKNGYKIIEIEGNNEYAPLAACMYAKGTKWCTSEEGAAGKYLSRGHLYVIFKNGQKILQTDLKEWKDLTNKEIDIIENDELSRVLVDSGLLNDPEKVFLIFSNKYPGFSADSRWPEVETILARSPKFAYHYAWLLKKPFPLGEPAIASDPEYAVMYAVDVLHGRFPEAEETIRRSADWSTVYNNYMEHFRKSEGKKQEVLGSRSVRLAYRLMRIAGLEDRVRFYVQDRKLSEETVRRLVKADPTPTGKYLGWIINTIVNYFGVGPNDCPDHWLNRIRKALAWYQIVSKSKDKLDYVGLPGDISKIDLDTLYNKWDMYKDEDLKTQAGVFKKAKGVAKVIYDKGPYKILQIGGEGVDPETAIKLACGYSQGTKWCTKDHNTAKGYLERGPLFLAFNGNEKLFLANYGGSEIKDTHNGRVEFTEDILFILLESGLLQLWADRYESSMNQDRLFDYIVYHMGVYPNWYPEFLQYLMDHRLVSPERMARSVEVSGERIPSVESYIATDPEAAFTYSRYVLEERWPEGEPAIRSVPELWNRYKKAFLGEVAHV